MYSDVFGEKKPTNFQYLLREPTVVPRFTYLTDSVDNSHKPKLSFPELEQGRNTTLVGMNAAGQVVAARGEKQRIATYGLGGCTAIGVVASFPDGRRRAHVQHYDPFGARLDVTKNSLEESILAQEARVGEYAQANQVDVAIMVPGLAYIEADDPAHVAWLTETIKREFGDSTMVHVTPYSPDEESGESHYAHALVIDIPAAGSPDIFPGMTRIKTG